MKFSGQRKIVILDSDLHRRDFLRSIVSETGAVPFFFDKTAICLDNVTPIAPDAVIAGPLPKEQAFRIILSLKIRSRSLPVVVFSADPDLQHFVSHNDLKDVTILRADAEPWEVEGTLGALIQKGPADQRLDQSNAPANAPVLIGHSTPMISLKARIETLSRIDDAVLVKGESGTGKELIARAIYYQSPRCGRPFVKIGLAELVQVFSASEFFDFRSGLAGSAGVTLRQALTAAAGGVLFLDDIGSLTSDFQAGLLGYFGDGDGACKPLAPNDVRLIVTGGDDIEQLVRAGGFRNDLYFRLNGISVTVPPLRQRLGDVGLLADFFADQFCMETGKGHFDLSADMKNLFESYPWPGNVGELRNAVRSAVLEGSEQPVYDRLCRLIQKGGLLQPSAAEGSLDRLIDLSGLRAYLKTQHNLALKHVCQTFTDRIEKKLIKRTLERTRWNRREAAQLLEISYKSILNKIKQYQLDGFAK